jgi:glutathione S-transferase
MKLYTSVGPNPRVVRMFAAEKGLSLPMVEIDLMGGENRRPPYSETVNVAGQTPALELEDGTTVTEITVICEYLEEKHPSPPLIGSTPEERAETRMWTRRIDLNVCEPMTTGFRATEGRRLFESRMKLLGAEGGSELKAIAKDRLLWLDGQLAGRAFVCGERFTLGDVMLYVFLAFGAQVGQPIPDEAAWTKDWFARVGARPSANA